MSQSDLDIANISRSLFRSEVNTALQALASQSSGATEPSITYAFQLWADTTTGKLKQRDAANSAWIEKGELASVDWGFLKKSNPAITGLLNLDDGADIASASTVDLTAATGNTVRITGTTAITAFTMNAGQQMELVAVGALPLTYNATTMNINGGVSYTCAAGDRLKVFKDGSGVVRVNVTKQDGTSVVGSSNSIFQGNSSVTVTDVGTGKQEVTIDGTVIQENTLAARKSTIDGGSTLYPEFKCRAWGNWNGAGTPAFRGSGNFSSITDNGTGDWTLNLSTAMPDTNYAVVLTPRLESGVSGNVIGVMAYSTSSVRVQNVNLSGLALIDSTFNNIAIFR